MRIKSLEIKGYKNITQKAVFDFTNSGNYIALIGLNGSGKSNVLEAISLIFGSLYQNKTIKNFCPEYDFSYKIIYTIENQEIQIENGSYTLLKQDGIIKNKEIKRKKRDYLPSEIFACYSGDELRLWEEIYSKHYFSYFRKLSRGFYREKQKLVYVNKHSWQIALLTLICHDDSGEYIKEIFKVDELTDISIYFDFPSNYDNRVDWYVRNIDNGEEPYNEALMLINTIKSRQEEKGSPLHFNEIRDIIVLQMGNNKKNCRKLFFLLFAIGMYKDKKLFLKIDITNDQLSLKQLSEGEKKLILIKCIMNVLANKNSIILLDEPDSHLHIVKKKEIKDYLQESDCYSILTSHSPSLLNSFPNEKTIILKNAENGLEVYKKDKFEILSDITNGEFSIAEATIVMSSNKPTLLVEGKFDINIIKTGLNKINQSSYNSIKNMNIFPIGGASGLRVFYKLIKESNNHSKVVALLDNDMAGNTEIEEILNTEELQNLKNNGSLEKDNFHFLMLPKLDRITNSQFEIEDYFKTKLLKKISKEKIDSFKVLKDFTLKKDTIKKELNKRIETFDVSEFEDFKILFDKINSILSQ
ncbi:AAA family ATPase [Bergeyella porcorum]|uniref:AAA family ATPase n=1 Tax=Bergeyella porcorum TaxID=1735111 RepID=UPI0035F01D21